MSAAPSPKTEGSALHVLRRYVKMSLRAATVVTLAAVLLFSAFGSFHWRLWWLVPPVWLVLFVLSLILAPVMRLDPGKGWAPRLPWLALVLISLAGLGAVALQIERDWTRITLALLAAAGLGAGVYGSRVAVLPVRHGRRERRRNFELRAHTEELLGAIRQMHHVALDMADGKIRKETANQSLDRIEDRLRGLLSEIREAAGRSGAISAPSETSADPGGPPTPRAS